MPTQRLKNALDGVGTLFLGTHFQSKKVKELFARDTRFARGEGSTRFYATIN